MALLVGRRTFDLQHAGSSPGWAPLRSGLGQVTYTCVPLSPSSIIWYHLHVRGVISLAGKVTAAWWKVTAAYHCRFMTNVTCGLTAKKPGSAPCATLVIEYGTTFYYYRWPAVILTFSFPPVSTPNCATYSHPRIILMAARRLERD